MRPWDLGGPCCVGPWGQNYIIHFAFGHRGKKLGGVHKIIKIPEETGGIHKKVGPFQCGMRIAEFGI